LKTAEQRLAASSQAAADKRNSSQGLEPAVQPKMPVFSTPSMKAAAAAAATATPEADSKKGSRMIEVILNDRLGKKVRVKCNSDDTVGTLKILAAAQLGTRPDKLRIQKW